MIVQKEDLRNLLVTLGISQATDWADERLLMKARTLHTISDIDEKKTSLSGSDREVLDDILKATRKDKKVGFQNAEEEDVNEGTNNEDSEETPVAPKKKKGDKKTKVVKVNSNEKTEKKGKKNNKKTVVVKDKPVVKSRGGKTIVGEVVACLEKATKVKPATLTAMLKRLVSEFPDHNEESMSRSIPWYIHNLKKKKGMKIVRENDGYVIA